MPKAIDRKPDKRFFGLFIGNSSSGKSSAAATFPRPSEIMDADMRIDGILWMRNLPKEFWSANGEPGFEGINYTTYSPDKGFADIEKALETYGIMFQKQRPFETLQIDSITSMLRLLLTDALHAEGAKVRKTLSLKRPGPNEYGYEADAWSQIMDFLRSLPCHVILSTHIVDRYGKEDPSDDYSETVKVGEQLSIRPKIGANIQIYFNEVYKFVKSESGKRHKVIFRSDIARTAFPQLPDEMDITGKNFYREWSQLVNKEAV